MWQTEIRNYRSFFAFLPPSFPKNLNNQNFEKASFHVKLGCKPGHGLSQNLIKIYQVVTLYNT